MKCPMCGSSTRNETKSYKYDVSGLDNVFLENIKNWVCNSDVCGEGGPIISSITELHLKIARVIIDYPLHGKEIKYLRKELGYEEDSFADLLCVRIDDIQEWENDTKEIPELTQKFIKLAVVYNQIDRYDFKDITQVDLDGFIYSHLPGINIKSISCIFENNSWRVYGNLSS